MKAFALRLFSQIRNKDEVIFRSNIRCFALVARSCKLSGPECNINSSSLTSKMLLKREHSIIDDEAGIAIIDGLYLVSHRKITQHSHANLT